MKIFGSIEVSNSAVVIGVLVIAVATYLLFGRKKKGFLVASAAEIPLGKMKKVTVGSQDVLLIHAKKGSFHAVGSRCPHLGASLEKGTLCEDRVVCPWHAAAFNIMSGDVEDGPSFSGIPVFPVIVDDGNLYIKDIDPNVSVKSCAPHVCSRDDSDSRHFIIIGAGPASLAAIETLRKEKYGGRISVVATEAVLPYDRTKLSKTLSSVSSDFELHPQDYYTSVLNVSLHLGKTVESVRTSEREIVLRDGEVMKYDQLLIATGGAARSFRADKGETFIIPGASLKNIYVLREIADTGTMIPAIQSIPNARVVIVGSSFIGMEIASTIRQSIKDVDSITVIGMEKEPFERVLGVEVGKLMRLIAERKKIKFIMESVVSEFKPSTTSSANVGSVVIKSSGVILPADIVIIGAGIIPSTSFLSTAKGITVEMKAPGGIRVNEFLQATDNVYCAGDVAIFPYKYGSSHARSGIRIEHWDVAIDQGRTAAMNMCGKKTAYEKIPFFWTGMFGKYVRYAGHAARPESTICHGDLNPEDPKFIVYYVEEGKITAVATMSSDPQAVAAMELLRIGKMPSPAEIRSTDAFDLQTYLEH